MPPDTRKIAADCFKKGTEAMSKENWDYAIDMVSRAATLDRGSLLFRQTLRGVEYKKYKNNKTGAKMAGMKLMTVKGRIKKARLKSNWDAIDRAAEDGLIVNPWDPQLNFIMGQACKNLGFMEVAIFGYRKAVEGEPNNKTYNRDLALLLEQRGEYSEAIQCWERIHKLDPHDGEARSKISGLQAQETTERGGYEDATIARDVKTAYDYDRPAAGASRGVPQGAAAPGDSVETDLRHAIRKDDTNKDHYLKLADFYAREKRLDEVAELLQKALEISGGDQNIREQLEDNELSRMRHNLELAKEAVRVNHDDESAGKNAAALSREFVLREVEIFSGRVDRYPKDTRLKYELANRFIRTQKWNQAIPLLQGAGTDTRIKTEVLVALAECFIAVKNNKLALRQLEKAVEIIPVNEKQTLFLKAHYQLARLYEEEGKTDDAEKHYNEVLGVDYEYRDALKRMERMQAGDADGDPS